MNDFINNVFEQTAFNHFFELKVAELIKSKHITIPTYLSLGTEHVPAVFSKVCKDYLLFVQHRCHSWYLSFGGCPIRLAKELLGRRDGCNGGYGGSASISCKDINMFGHSGLLGDQIPIAVGAAAHSGKPTIVHLGDAAIEEDYALGALGYAVTKKAPILFVCEDNNLSILTEKKVRRSWSAVDIAKSFGMMACDITDSIFEIQNAAYFYTFNNRLPAFININVCRNIWHAGCGRDGEPEWDSYQEIRSGIDKVYRTIIEESMIEEVEGIWQPLLKP